MYRRLRRTSIMANRMIRPRVTRSKRYTGGRWRSTQHLLGWPLRTCGSQDGMLCQARRDRGGGMVVGEIRADRKVVVAVQIASAAGRSSSV